MILANIEWIGTLCSALSLACSVQLIITGILAFSVPEMLLLTGSHFSTCSGLIAGFIALPTALRLKTAQISPNMDRVYGYTLCYQRLAVGIAGIIHLTSIVFVITALSIKENLENDFISLMKYYNRKHTSKILVDNIQYLLQCCGGTSYKDWFNINWSEYVINEREKSEQYIKKMLLEATDNFSGLELVRNDLVPYSCCARSVLSACIHSNLIQLGVLTINTGGCGIKILFVVRVLLWFEFLIYMLCFILEIGVISLLKKQPNGKKLKNKKINKLNFNNDWETFSNAESYKAEIIPSSHSQITITKSDIQTS